MFYKGRIRPFKTVAIYWIVKFYETLNHLNQRFRVLLTLLNKSDKIKFLLRNGTDPIVDRYILLEQGGDSIASIFN